MMLPFFKVSDHAPLPVDLVVTDEVFTAILAVGCEVMKTLRDEKDYETAADLMTAEGEWLMWAQHRSVELEIKRHANSRNVILQMLPWHC